MSEENSAGTEPGENTNAAGNEPAAFLFENADPQVYGEDNVNFLKTNNLTNMSDLVALAAKGKNSIALPDDTPESLLAFRKACGLPDTAEGYGLPVQTDDEKEIADFLLKCNLDKWAAKTVYQNILDNIASEDKAEKEKYAAEYAKATEAWGDNKQGNLNLLKRGMDTIKVSDEQLRRISDAIGTEAALGLMLTVGKLTQDSVGVSGTGTGGGGDESLFDLILSKRDE